VIGQTGNLQIWEGLPFILGECTGPKKYFQNDRLLSDKREHCSEYGLPCVQYQAAKIGSQDALGGPTATPSV